jgi:Restriction endonuclease
MNFDAAAADMHRQELARLSEYVTPTPEQLRSMTAAALSAEIAGMWERLGHEVITNPDDATGLVHRMGERKFITACANPSDATPTRSAAIRRLRDRVVASSAEHGFFFSVRGFTAEALHYAAAAPVQSVDCAQLVRELTPPLRLVPVRRQRRSAPFNRAAVAASTRGARPGRGRSRSPARPSSS